MSTKTRDFIPTRDADLVLWAENFIQMALVNKTALGVAGAQINPVGKARDAFVAALTALEAQPRASNLVLAKNTARRHLVALIRDFVNHYVRFNRNVDDQFRHEMGLNFPHNLPPTPVPPLTIWPSWRLDTSTERRVIIHVINPHAPRGGRPAGATSFELAWCLKAPGSAPPEHESDFHNCEIGTRSPITLVFDLNQRGHTVYFMLRWINTTGHPGPWSPVGEAIVP